MPSFPSLKAMSVPDWVLGFNTANWATVDMDFANGRYFGDTLANLLSCSRASTGYALKGGGDRGATLVSFGTNTLRITDHGLLVEEARTNLCVQSQDFITTWTDAGSGITALANQATAPDGTLTADKLTVSGGGANIQSGTFTLATSTSYTVSAYFKVSAGDSTITFFGAGDGNNFLNAFTLIGAGSVGSSLTQGSATVISASIEALANGWYRCQVTGQIAAGGANARVIIYPGAVSNAVFAWGAQAELGAFPTSYIPTTTATVTRAEDVVTTLFTANTLPGWWVARFTPFALTTTARILGASGATSNAPMIMQWSGSDLRADGAGDVPLIQVVSGNMAVTYENRACFTYDADGLNFVIGLNSLWSDTEINPGTVYTPPSVITVGGKAADAPRMNGYFTRVAFGHTFLTSAQVQSLTTP